MQLFQHNYGVNIVNGTRTLGRVIAPGSIPIAYDSPLHSASSFRKNGWRPDGMVCTWSRVAAQEYLPREKAPAVIESPIAITT